MYVYDHVLDAGRAVLLYPKTPESRPWRGTFFDGCEVAVDFVPLLFDGRPDAGRVQGELLALVARHQGGVAADLRVRSLTGMSE